MLAMEQIKRIFPAENESKIVLKYARLRDSEVFGVLQATYTSTGHDR
jgi:hypothetical protein